MHDFELHRWFAAEELGLCSACAKRAVIPVDGSGPLLCLECGHVEDAPDAPPYMPPGDLTL
jgi:hypothetical protein